jgi:large subunit ribosomal protein L19
MRGKASLRHLELQGAYTIIIRCDIWEGANEMTDILNSLNSELELSAPDIRPGDTVRVHFRIVEGEKERVQVFQGVLMRLRKGGVNASFTVRRIAAHGIGVERTFPLYSPRVERVEILRRAKVRRAQLYFLRKYRGKAARLKEDRSMYERKKK